MVFCTLLLRSKLSFDRHCSILIFKGDNYPDAVIGMLFRLVHCDSRGDKPVDDGINKVIRIPQLTEDSSRAGVTLCLSALKFYCLVNETLCIQDLKPALNAQSDPPRAKAFM